MEILIEPKDIFDGCLVGDLLMEALNCGDNVTLRIAHDAILHTSFLHSSIGVLYGRYSEQFIHEHLTFISDYQYDYYMFELVKDNAIKWYTKRDILKNEHHSTN